MLLVFLDCSKIIPLKATRRACYRYSGRNIASLTKYIPYAIQNPEIEKPFNRWEQRRISVHASGPRKFSMSAIEDPFPSSSIESSPPPTSMTMSTTPMTKNTKIVPFLLADIGEGIAEVEIMQWFIQEGDNVKQFDRLCEVQSDKATVEISSRYDGVVKKLHYQIGSIAKVGMPLVDIEVPTNESQALPTINNLDPPPAANSGTVTASSSPPPLSIPPASHTASAPSTEEHEVIRTTPAVRRLAKEWNVDLSHVKPSGPQGRVLKGDVLEYIRGRESTAHVVNGLTTPPAPASNVPVTAPLQLQLPPLLPPSAAAAAIPTPPSTQQPQAVPVRGVMRQMIKSMTASLKIPHFGYQDEVVMDKAMALRESLKPLAEAQGYKFSFLPIMLKAASLALLHYPILNASLSSCETEIIYHPDHNIGIAMDTPKGLVVPVLRKVQEKSLFQLAKELTEFQQLAATGSFTEEHFTGATFSLSNIGSIGGTYMDPTIVPPQVAIGAMGKIQRLPRFAEDGETVVGKSIMAVSWSGDHRVIDGATMANFSNRWKAYLEEPAWMLADTK